MNLYKFGLICSAAALLAACDSTPKFTVTGTIEGAEGKVLYLDNIGLDGLNVLDSVKLKSNGKFELEAAAPMYPDFYRLRVDANIINFAIDSTETVNVEAKLASMATGYTISGEDNNRIKALALKQISLQDRINSLSKSDLLPGEIQDSIQNMISAYKHEVDMDYIFKAPQLPSSYFALFQTVNGYLIYDPVNNKQDVQCYGAVATSWDNSYPHSERAGNLHNITIRGMKNTRTQQVKEVDIDPAKVSEAGLINIALPDIKGKICNLTDLAGKVALLDFTIYNHNQSGQRNLYLREIYDKYKDRGFEIYQISLDADEHFWKTNAVNLPWICVHDANGLYSPNLPLYGIQDLPTYFIIDRSNQIVKKSDQVTDLESEISKLL